ncbi:hypothetical protein [Aureimonas jatrophae]|uniref:Uncharacterized protein n=2 Tax=Aureimonas jatrophae TaxID=1166073 RepID=A0A1H0M5S5_9HYPH|nr:hypothetical protein [Aureimonas jatrophae]SDO75744.1 hypothetical protein SAMN05192530_11279 [Aureimonas jatrophae]
MTGGVNRSLRLRVAQRRLEEVADSLDIEAINIALVMRQNGFNDESIAKVCGFVPDVDVSDETLAAWRARLAEAVSVRDAVLAEIEDDDASPP